MPMVLRETLWHEIGENEKCLPQDIIAKDIHIRWDGDRMEISKNGAISKDQFIDAITKLFQNIDKIVGDK
jgi:hypothetical protein